MTLFDIIYDFFWNLFCPSGEVGSLDTIMNLTIHIGDNLDDLTLIDYFAFICSIISLVIIVIICCQVIKKVYNIFAHVIA